MPAGTALSLSSVESAAATTADTDSPVDAYDPGTNRVRVASVAHSSATPETAPETVPGEAMWFMLRELRTVQERLDRLQTSFDQQSRDQRTADKSDH
jgi:hypothetical protein